MNGSKYYFAVTAIKDGVEGIPSEQVEVTPFDTTQLVLASGSMAEGGQRTPIVDISSTAPSASLPSWQGSEQMTGLLNPRELDYYGYGNLMNDHFGCRGCLLGDPTCPHDSDRAGNGLPSVGIPDRQRRARERPE